MPDNTETPINLSVQDLMTAAQLIQLGTQRGAWRVEELSTVGGLYDRLLAFLEASGAITRGTAAAETPAEPAADTAPGPKENTSVKTRRKA